MGTETEEPGCGKHGGLLPGPHGPRVRQTRAPLLPLRPQLRDPAICGVLFPHRLVATAPQS